ncbi:MAG TPA: PEGA domain-containing protein [Polyangiaceae bacterium]|nr:PEGA domain-containing protein [Polyangiaceae bacterium]
MISTFRYEQSDCVEELPAKWPVVAGGSCAAGPIVAKFRAVKSTSFARRALAVLSVGFGLYSLSSPPPTATAQTRNASQKLEAIRQLMEKGQGQYIAGNYQGAADVFEGGFKQYPYSAFLFNAGVCYQKLGDADRALGKFRDYLKVDPTAPDAEKVKQRIALLETAKGIPAPPAVGGSGGSGGTEAGGTAGSAPVPVTPQPQVDDESAMRSLVVVETEPPDAPLRFYSRTDDNAAAFKLGGQNPGWKEIANARAPANLTLSVGKYHVVVEKFRDFNESHADIDVSPGHVYQFKANLSQGEFMAFLRVSANVKGAYIWLDDKKKERPFWGTTPHGELVSAGPHEVLVEAPGFEPLLAPVMVNHGEQKEMEVAMVRVNYGFLRIDSNAPEVKVRIDEQPKGVWKAGTEALDVQAPSGPHKLTVLSDGRKTFEAMVNVPRGQVLPVHVKMIPKYPRGAAWTQAVIGAAFIGAAAYFGNESNKLYDQLKADGENGRLEEGDSRVTKGRWYAVGADGGFAVGGVLGILATYNFIKDPLPESSIRTDKPVEFDDPRKRQPVALLPSGGPTQRLVRKDRQEPGLTLEPPKVSVGAVGPDAPGLFIGGKF